MIIETMKILRADKGKILTDGTAYGKNVILPKNRSEDEFTEITEKEYNKIIKAEEEKALAENKELTT